MDEITLHQPPGRAFGMPNLSPFCVKLETYLRMAEVPYKLAPMRVGQMPKGKVPYVHMDGAFIGDSQLVLEAIEHKLGDRALDAGLSARDAAIGRITRRMLEEATAFCVTYVRWQLDAGFRVLRTEFKKLVPAIVLPLLRRRTVKKLHAQGIGRHTPDEVMALAAPDFDALAELLGDNPYLLGDAPRTVDASGFAFCEAVLGFPVDSPLKAAAASHPNLVAYRQRIRDRWFQDLA